MDVTSPINTRQFTFDDFSPGIIVTPLRQTSVSDVTDAKILEEKLRTRSEHYLLEGTFDIILTDRPLAPVTIDLTTQEGPSNIVFPRSVTFTPDNWNIPQNISVKIPSTIDTRGSDVIHIRTSPAISDDPHYNDYKASNVDIIIPHNGQVSKSEVLPIERQEKPVAPNQSPTNEANAHPKPKSHVNITTKGKTSE